MLTAIEDKIKEILHSKYSDKLLSLKASDIAVDVVWNEEKNVNADATTTVCLKYSKIIGVSPKILAEEIIQELSNDAELSNILVLNKIEVAGPGYINFTLTDEFIESKLSVSVKDIIASIKNKNINNLNGKTVLVEYTDANPFKVFHIGHLMTNIIGESIANIHELMGAKVKRVNYQGDVGRHIAINIFAILSHMDEYAKIKNENDIKTRVKWLGDMYAKGYKAFDDAMQRSESGISTEEDKDIINKVKEINKKIYDKSDEIINEIYKSGRSWSLEYFEKLYHMLGTKFDKYIFESEAAPIGLKLIEENINIFEKSDGALIYNGEQDGLHKRVFISSEGLPTYEGKDIGNMSIKLNAYESIDKSIMITGNEQTDYFKVLFTVLHKIFGTDIDLKHYGHGLMKFTDGKMSSRKGNVLAGDELIYELVDTLRVKFENSRIDNKEEKEDVIEKVAIGAIKYSILRQAIGRDVIFDLDNAISIDGDSGPYLQYTYARINGAINSELTTAESNEMEAKNSEIKTKTSMRELLLIILRFETVLSEAALNISPQVIATYLIELAHAYNSFYAVEKIRDNVNNINLSYKVRDILHAGLHILGIKTPSRM